MDRGETLIFLATYNEIENLPSLVAGIHQVEPTIDILVIDDGSPDGTGKWCEAESAKDKRLRCIHRTGKLGLGTATVAGMRYAIEKGYDYVLSMDADFSHHPRHLPAILQGIRQPTKDGPVDIMVGSRYAPGGAIEGWPMHRHFMSRGVNMYARLLLGLPTKDCSGAYRCYRTEVLKKVDFDAIRSKGYAFQEEILWRLKMLGARFAETPITFKERQSGASKINSHEAWAALRIIMELGLSNIFGEKAKRDTPRA